MKWWRWILLLVLVAVLAAFAWHGVALDPGRVQIDIHGWRIDTTVVAAVIIIIVVVVILILAWRLLRWPFGAIGRRRRRIARRDLLVGLIALEEGQFGRAGRALTRAARDRSQHAVAWLAAAHLAARRGDVATALEGLAKAGRAAPQAARIARAHILRRAGRGAEALALLAPQATNGTLPPAGWLEWLEATLDAGDVAGAWRGLEPIRKSGVLGDAAYTRFEARVLVAAIAAAPGAPELDKLWSGLSRVQRRRSEVVAAYARRAAQLGQAMAAIHELEAGLRRQWSGDLVAMWGDLADVDVDDRLRRAEGWLTEHPDDPLLLTTLGRLCAQLDIWGKAREYLTRALATTPSAAAWEAMGEVYAGQGNLLLSQRCYRNALRIARGEPTEPLPGLPVPDHDGSGAGDLARDAHGIPHLADDGSESPVR